MPSYYGASTSGGANTIASAAAQEAEREARRARIKAEINQKEGEIDDLNQQIRKLKEEINDLHTLRNNRNTGKEMIDMDLAERRHRVDCLGNIDSVCLCSEKYHEGMWEDLNSVRLTNIYSAIYDKFDKIQREVSNRENKIEELERKIRSLREAIENLRSQL